MSSNKIDLHTHTIYSDGELTPDELINLALLKNIKTLAITDHDTIEGLKAITNKNLKVIPGIELSTDIAKGKFHLLGYNLDIENEYLNQEMDKIRNNSIYYTMSLLAKLAEMYHITFDETEVLKLLNKKGYIGRPHVAKLCVKYDYANTIKESYKLYLNEVNNYFHNTYKSRSFMENIELIKRAGGIPVLAHPYTLRKDYNELKDYLYYLTTNGLEGIEVYHSNHTPQMINDFKKLADYYNLLITVGSDYHGPILKPQIKIGSGIDNNIIQNEKLKILERLK